MQVGEALLAEQGSAAEQRVGVRGETVPGADAPDQAPAAILDPETAAVLRVGAELLQQRVGACEPELAPALLTRLLVDMQRGQHRSGGAVEQLVRRVVGVRRDELEQALLLLARRLELPRDEKHADLALHQAGPPVGAGQRPVAGEEPAFADPVT